MSGSPEAASVQLQDEVGREGREKLLSSADFCREITPHEALAMKANLGLPWKKLRIMSRYMYMPNTIHKRVHSISYNTRWLKERGLTLPSEKRQRALSHDVLGDNLKSEAAPFSFPLKHGGEDLRPAPYVYVPDLPAMIFQHLDQNDRYTSMEMVLPSTCNMNVHIMHMQYEATDLARYHPR